MAPLSRNGSTSMASTNAAVLKSDDMPYHDWPFWLLVPKLGTPLRSILNQTESNGKNDSYLTMIRYCINLIQSVNLFVIYSDIPKLIANRTKFHFYFVLLEITLHSHFTPRAGRSRALRLNENWRWRWRIRQPTRDSSSLHRNKPHQFVHRYY